MAGAPGTIGSQVPPGPDEIWRQIAVLQQQAQQALAFAANAQATSSQLAANVAALAASGVTWAGPVASPSTVTASGTITGNKGIFPNGLNSTDVYSHLLTYGGSYHSTWAHVDGTIGYVPSSRRFKQDEAPAEVDTAAVLSLRVETFRYIAAVEQLGADAPVETGLIAEDVDALGLNLLVDYDAEGKPFGVKLERLALALLPVVQALDARLAALEARA